MDAFLPPADRPNFFLRIGIWISEKITGQKLLPARILAWYPKGAVGAGVLEALTPHGHNLETRRLLKLVRLQTSLAIACPFCIDMNSLELAETGITPDELEALQGIRPFSDAPTLSEKERLSLEWVKQISQTPVGVDPLLGSRLASVFSPREMVMIAQTSAQVNYWGRLIQALGIPPAGFNPSCPIPLPGRGGKAR